jgi:hypothetical protein
MVLVLGCAIKNPAPAPEADAEIPQKVRVSGFSCENGYGASLNQVYIYQGKTADGRPYYRGETRTDRYFYYDARCADDTPDPRWLVGGKPDPTRTSDLNPRDGDGCDNDFSFETDARAPMMGTHKTAWLWCGDQGSRGRRLTLSVD